MKKILSTGILALTVAALSQQTASAWVNLNAGVGANLGFQSGGNCLLWGAFRNGQPPAAGGCAGHCAAPVAPTFAAPQEIMPGLAPAQTQSHIPARHTIPAYQTGNVRYPAYNPHVRYRR